MLLAEPEAGRECYRGAGRWIKVSTNRTGASSAIRDSGGNSGDEKSATWGAAKLGNIAFVAERIESQRSLKCVVHDGSVLEREVDFKFKGNVFQGNSSGRAPLRVMCFYGTKRKLHTRRAQPVGSVPEQACEAASWHRPEELGTQSPKKRHI